MTDGASEAEGTDGADRTPQARLEAAAEGLLFTSEIDAPFEYVEFPGVTAADLAPQTVARTAGDADAPVETRALDDFLSGQIEQADPADPEAQENVPRFRALRDALTAALSDVRVYRVGDADVRYYLVGVTEDGRVAGLVTRALET